LDLPAVGCIKEIKCAYRIQEIDVMYFYSIIYIQEINISTKRKDEKKIIR